MVTLLYVTEWYTVYALRMLNTVTHLYVTEWYTVYALRMLNNSTEEKRLNNWGSRLITRQEIQTQR